MKRKPVGDPEPERPVRPSRASKAAAKTAARDSQAAQEHRREIRGFLYRFLLLLALFVGIIWAGWILPRRLLRDGVRVERMGR